MHIHQIICVHSEIIVFLMHNCLDLLTLLHRHLQWGLISYDRLKTNVYTACCCHCWMFVHTNEFELVHICNYLKWDSTVVVYIELAPLPKNRQCDNEVKAFSLVSGLFSLAMCFSKVIFVMSRIINISIAFCTAWLPTWLPLAVRCTCIQILKYLTFVLHLHMK